MTASHTPKLDLDALGKRLAAVAERAKPGVLGMGLGNLESGETWFLNPARPFPMQSVAKMALGAAALAEADAGRLPLAETLTLSAQQLSPPWSPIADAWPGRASYTVEELLTAAIVDSDNTAADVLMKRIGGPGAVTAWLQGKRLDEVRVDRYEREMQPEMSGMASFRPAWKGAAAYGRAKASVPMERRRKALSDYLADPRDTATPRAMISFLIMLDGGELITPGSTGRLEGLMLRAGRGVERLKAGLPPGTTFAHKPGTSGTEQGVTAAFNDVGIATLPDGRRYAMAAFLAGSTADEATRTTLLGDIGRAFTAALG